MPIEIVVKYSPSTNTSPPWINKIVSWPVGGHPKFEWGHCSGDNINGWELRIKAIPGDIVVHGYGHKGGWFNEGWYVVQPDGSLEKIDPLMAREVWENRPAGIKSPIDLSSIDTIFLVSELNLRGTKSLTSVTKDVFTKEANSFFLQVVPSNVRGPKGTCPICNNKFVPGELRIVWGRKDTGKVLASRFGHFYCFLEGMFGNKVSTRLEEEFVSAGFSTGRFILDLNSGKMYKMEEIANINQ
jgi:hypothetical protein